MGAARLLPDDWHVFLLADLDRNYVILRSVLLHEPNGQRCAGGRIEYRTNLRYQVSGSTLFAQIHM